MTGKVVVLTISALDSGQRIDNYLLKKYPKVPKSRLYRALRKGEVRINKKRVKPEYKLEQGDEVRVPPLRIPEPLSGPEPNKYWQTRLQKAVIYEDKGLMILNKPSGLAVHGGSNLKTGLINQCRLLFTEHEYLELAHRLDRDTSGCLILAKSPDVLRELQQGFKEQRIEKTYLALVAGRWPAKTKKVNLSLVRDANRAGERMVQVSEHGKQASSEFSVVEYYKNCSLVEIKLKTGRTHQIRVHASHLGHPLLGDLKYGDNQINKQFRKEGLQRLFLHAYKLELQCSYHTRRVVVEAELPKDLQQLLGQL